MTTVVEGPRSFTTTPDDHSGIAITVATMLLTWSIIVFIIRLYTRIQITGSWGLDDLFCSFATAAGIIQTLIACTSIAHGFGKSLFLLAPEQIIQVGKLQYAGDLLYIVAVCLGKCAMPLLNARITCIRKHLVACYALLAVVSLWGVAALITEAILDRPFTIGHPPSNLVASWGAIAAFDVITEIAMFALSIWLIWDIQMSRDSKTVIVVAFSLRLPVIASTIARVAYFGPALSSSNPYLDGVVPFVCTQVELHYGIMATTLPCLKPFVRRLDTGWGTTDTQGVSGYAMGTLKSKSGRSGQRSVERSGGSSNLQGSTDGRSKVKLRPDVPGNMANIRSGTRRIAEKRSSSAGSSGSEQMIIRRTISTEVRYEEPRGKRTASETENSVDSVV